MDIITSQTNQRIKGLVLLRDKRKERSRSQSFIIEGIRLVEDTNEADIREIFITDELYEKVCAEKNTTYKRLYPLIEKCMTTQVSREVFNKISDTMTPQGVLAVAKMPEYDIDDIVNGKDGKGRTLILVLEDVQDPGNLGTMFRTAEAAGVTGILMSRGTADLFNPKTVRSTMSSVFRVPFVYTDDLENTIRELKKEQISFYAAYLGENKTMYDKVDYTGRCGILIGNEGNGLKPETAAVASERIIIPMQGQIESLNAAMSAGILMYEASRQRRQNKA